MAAVRKVLVVDDDPVVGKSFDRVLTRKGYLVVTAENAAQALEKVREQNYDVVFTDIKMPGMSGIELAEQVKARTPWTPVVIVTGYGSRENQERAQAAGVSAFLNKPLSPDMIEDSAAQAIMGAPAAAAVAAAVAAAAVAPAAPAAAALAEAVSAPAATQQWLRNVALFLAAPFIGLVYAVMLPMVGMLTLAWIGSKTLRDHEPSSTTPRYARHIGTALAAPFIGLVYALVLPLAGLATMLWMGYKTLAEMASLDLARRCGLLLAAPFIGLTFAVALPFLGLGMLVWTALSALVTPSQAVQ